ncbi:MAG TPA: YciI family protein [Candidatus Dormibacteraeota bacterium]
MKYMLLFIDDQEAFNSIPDEQRGALYQQVGEWWGKHSSEGRIVGGEQLQPPSTATTVRHSHNGGAPVTTDGPFIETKENIGGFAIVDVPDLDQALELARTWPARGVVEVRPLFEDAGTMDGDHDH